MGWGEVGHVVVGWGWAYRGGVDGASRGEVGWVMQGGVGHAGVGWVL